MEKSKSSRKARKEKLTAEFAKKAQRTQREIQDNQQPALSAVVSTKADTQPVFQKKWASF